MTYTANTKDIELTVHVCNSMSDLGVCVGIPFKMTPFYLKQLSSVTPFTKKNEAKDGIHEAALAYALFETIRDKMMGSPTEVNKVKVSNLRCKALDGHFNLYWNCPRTGTALRKTMSTFFKCLDANRLFAKYRENLKFLNVSGSRECFVHCAKILTDGFGHIKIVAIGRISTDAEKIKAMLAQAAKQLPHKKVEGHGEKAKLPPCDIDMFPSVKCSDGVARILVADYISSNSGGMSTEVHTGLVEVYNMGWESKHAALKSVARIKAYTARYAKIKPEDLTAYIAYYAIVREFASAGTLASLVRSKLTHGDIASKIKDVL